MRSELCLGAALIAACSAAHGGATAPPLVEEVLVTGSIAGAQGDLGSLTVVDEEALRMVRATHPNESFVRIPGVWIVRGSGQEHLSAIRSPVFTGPGSCGEFLLLENGVPVRPTGFCNVNNLFEINTEQAHAVEVLRGPAGAAFGGNALFGTVNVVSAVAPDATRFSLEAGADDYVQGRFSGSIGDAARFLRIDAQATTTNGFRANTGHDEQKVNLTWVDQLGAFEVHTLVAATRLDQETGGFVLGFEAYDDPIARRSNPNPEAYRDAWAVRLSSEWRRVLEDGREITFTPYLRKSEMDFLQHFLPGQPREDNGQRSAGVQISLAGGDRIDWRLGLVGEWARGDLFEYQEKPAEGSPFIQATRPVGVHYDYEVDSRNAAVFYDLTVPLGDAVELVHGARVEWLEYDYDNRGLDGNTRDDGTPCGFGGCLYTRPADRDDDFVDVAGRLGVQWRIAEGMLGYAISSTGFRAPQATELYRLQSGQEIAELDSERITSIEFGVRYDDALLSTDVALFVAWSKDLVLRDANGFNVSEGKIDSAGIELSARYTPVAAHAFELATTYAQHEYAFDRVIAQGEVIESGNDVDTAPHWLGSARWRWQPQPRILSELEVVYMGEHYVNAENSARYKGHTLINWRTSVRATSSMSVFARLMNVADERYADRADFAFGNYRYFPGTPRQLFVGFEMTL